MHEAARDRWVIETADHTLERLIEFDDEPNDYAGIAQDEYDDAITPYCEGAIEALESLAKADEAEAST